MPPAPPPAPAGAGAMRPSLGCTRTQPGPENAICTVSPEPRPISVFRLTSVLMDVWTLDAQVIAADGSAYVGISPVWSSTGGPSEMTATQPVPDRAML